MSPALRGSGRDGMVASDDGGGNGTECLSSCAHRLCEVSRPVSGPARLGKSPVNPPRDVRERFRRLDRKKIKCIKRLPGGLECGVKVGVEARSEVPRRRPRATRGRRAAEANWKDSGGRANDASEFESVRGVYARRTLRRAAGIGGGDSS